MRASRRFHSPWLTSPTTDEAFDRLLRRVEDERYEPLFVCLRHTGAIAGYINIGEIVRGSFQSAFLGYGAVATYAGQGYMGEGLELVLARAFRDIGDCIGNTAILAVSGDIDRRQDNVAMGHRHKARERFGERKLTVA